MCWELGGGPRRKEEDWREEGGGEEEEEALPCLFWLQAKVNFQSFCLSFDSELPSLWDSHWTCGPGPLATWPPGGSSLSASGEPSLEHRLEGVNESWPLI